MVVYRSITCDFLILTKYLCSASTTVGVRAPRDLSGLTSYSSNIIFYRGNYHEDFLPILRWHLKFTTKIRLLGEYGPKQTSLLIN